MYLIIVLILTYLFTSFKNYNIDLLKILLGFDLKGESLIPIIMFLLKGSMILLMFSSIFFEDIENNCGNLFLRMKKTNWLIYKQISTYIILFLFYMVLYSFLFIIGFMDMYLIGLFFKDLIIIIFIVQLLYIIALIINDFKYILVLYLLFAIVMYINSFNFIEISAIYYLMLAFFLFILNMVFYKEKIIEVIERCQL